ncbi:MAG TPA: MaoC family dehydratase [Burkholderiales bacterium]
MGRHTFTEDEILSFGREFDPQPFHADPAAAGETVFGGLIASGWHTCSVGMRLMVQSYLARTVSLGSPGIDDIRWLKPVRPGDTLVYRRTVVEARASTTRKGVGLVKHRWEAVNQHGELVLTMEGWGLFGRKN